jgi:hypothetical protein
MAGFTKVNAQFISVPYTMSTPRGNVTMQHHLYMPTHYSNSNSNPKFNFEVTLKDDSVIKFKSRILSENKTLYIVQKEGKDKIKIFPEDTKSCIAHFGSNFGSKIGIPADSCWLFKINVGPINGYSSIPSTYLNNAIAIQKGEEGKIVTLNKKNLKEMVEPCDEKLDKLISKSKFAKAIEYYNDMTKSNTKK